MRLLSALRARNRGRRVFVALSTALTIVAAMVGLVLPAHGTPTPSVDVQITGLTKIDATHEESPGRLTLGDHVKLSFAWDTTIEDNHAHPSFAIELGDHFSNVNYPSTTRLEFDNNGTLEPIADCSLARTKITCRFNDTVHKLRSAGVTHFSGSTYVSLKASQETQETRVPLRINRKKVFVDLPQNGGIAPARSDTFIQQRFTHHLTTPLNRRSSSMEWAVVFGAQHLTSLMSDSSENDVPDTTFSFVNTVEAGHLFDTDKTRWHLGIADTPKRLSKRLFLADATGKDLNLASGDFDIDVTINDARTQATITVRGPFTDDVNYAVYYETVPASTSGTIAPGIAYHNTVELVGSGKTESSTASYTTAFGPAPTVTPGFGAFDVTTQVDGAAANKVVRDTQFALHVEYVLPHEASFYEGWEPPGTLNEDGTSGTATVTTTVGEDTPFLHDFPQGTRITLSQDPASVHPTNSSIRWGTPTLLWKNKETDSFIIPKGTVQPFHVTIVHHAEPFTGSMVIQNKISGPPVAESNSESTFTYECTSVNGRRTQSGTVTLGVDESVTVDAIPLGSCVVKEHAHIADSEAAPIDTIWTINGSDKKSTAVSGFQSAVVVRISAEHAVVPVVATNTYVGETGRFHLTTEPRGDNADAFAAKTYAYSVDCDQGEHFRMATTGDAATPAVSKELPAGTECTISSELNPEQHPGYVADTALEPRTITIGAGTTSTVSAVTTFTRTTGVIRIKKKTTGNSVGEFVGTPSTFTVTCDGQEPLTLQMSDASGAVDTPPIPSGSTCTVEEDAIAAPPGYVLAKSYSPSQTLTVMSNTIHNFTATHNYSPLVGSFILSEEAIGDGVGRAPQHYMFRYDCADTQGNPTVSGELGLGTGTSQSVDGIPAGSCTISELKDTGHGAGTAHTAAWMVNNSPHETATVPDTAFSGVTIPIQDGAPPVAVRVTDSYTLERGTFSVAATVDTATTGGAAQETVDVTYKCTSETEGTREGSLNGFSPTGAAQPSNLTLPVGTTCTITEFPTASHIDGYTLESPPPVTITIDEKDQVVPVTFSNTYSRDTGTVSIAASVSGVPSVEDKDFVFAIACDDGQEATAQVLADGRPVSVVGPRNTELRVPVGTTCTITEDAESAAVDGYVWKAPAPSTVTVTQKDQVVAVSFLNKYVRLSPGQQPQSSSPSAQAADTQPQSGAPQSGAPQSGAVHDNAEQSGPPQSGTLPEQPAQAGTVPSDGPQPAPAPPEEPQDAGQPTVTQPSNKQAEAQAPSRPTQLAETGSVGVAFASLTSTLLLVGAMFARQQRTSPLLRTRQLQRR
ncbi:MAG: hypothetical protein CSA82_03615 [Actinobacteria bacterium]|nr:MAG: hypothetical protein CSA82_03615 [Actinomycetota bacterium]